MRGLLAVACLVLALPFEPMEPAFRMFGLEVSALELIAAVLLALAALTVRVRTPVPLLPAVLALIVTFFVSSLFVDGAHGPPLKFSLRMAAGLLTFIITSWTLARAYRPELVGYAFAAAGAMTATVVLSENLAPSAMQTLVAPFREHAFEVGGRYRAAATFAYPNITASFLALTLPFAMASALDKRLHPAAFAGAVGIFTALVLTYSRGGLIGAIAATSVFALWTLRARPERRSTVLAFPACFAAIALTLLIVEPSFRWRAASEGDEAWYRAEIVPESEAIGLPPGGLTRTPVHVANAGILEWRSHGEKPFHLSYRWFRTDGAKALVPLAVEGERTPLPRALRPGDTVELLATVRAPRDPGEYWLVWDMVHEHTTWFSDKVGLGSPVRVRVGSVAPARPVSVETLRDDVQAKTWRPGRRELWSLAFRLFRQQPVLGVGPDNFRWLYGPVAGVESWDTRVFSNSLYLELLATIGIIGFLAFVFLAVRCGVGLAGLEAPDAFVIAVAASLVGFLVHGLFDYLLAFTPIYLAVFVLLGVVSAAIRKGKARA